MRILKSLVFGAAVTLTAQAQAATVDADASITLTGIQTNGTASFTLDGYDWFDTVAIANDVYYDFYAEDGYTDLYNASAGIDYTLGGATGSANADADADATVASARANGAGSAFADAYSELGFTVDGTGEVILTFDYSLSASITGAFSDYETAQASVYVEDSLALGGIGYHDLFLDGYYGDDALSDALTFDLMLSIDGADTGFLTLQSTVIADTGVTPVPLPAAAWLFFTGLAGLAGAGYRNQHH